MVISKRLFDSIVMMHVWSLVRDYLKSKYKTIVERNSEKVNRRKWGFGTHPPTHPYVISVRRAKQNEIEVRDLLEGRLHQTKTKTVCSRHHPKSQSQSIQSTRAHDSEFSQFNSSIIHNYYFSILYKSTRFFNYTCRFPNHGQSLRQRPFVFLFFILKAQEIYTWSVFQ